MAYQVMTREGIAINCATPEEALAMAKAVAQADTAAERRTRRANGAKPVAEASPPPGPPVAQNHVSSADQATWMPPPRLRAFYDHLSEQQQRAIRTIARAPGEISLN